MRIPAANLASLETLDPTLYKTLKDHLDKIGGQLNQLTEGSIVAVTNAQAFAPPSGARSLLPAGVPLFQPGDFVKNSNRAELGAPGSKYILDGWECASSDPLDWYARRLLTGN